MANPPTRGDTPSLRNRSSASGEGAGNDAASCMHLIADVRGYFEPDCAALTASPMLGWSPSL